MIINTRHIFSLLWTIAIAWNVQSSVAFQPSDSLNKKRLLLVSATEVIGYSAVMIGLNELWYKQYPRSKFHTFNDNNQWLQMDKFGHATTAYYVGYLGNKALIWAGLDKRKPIWYGGTLGLVFLTSVELLDSFSSEWGFSWGDQLANTAGTGLLIGQEYFWKEQRVLMKFSAHTTSFAKLRPMVLGSTFSERLLKDYNGQTHWLSANIASFLRKDSAFPKWINIAVGYSASGMLFGNQKGYSDYCNGVNILEQTCLQHQPERQFYFSLDLDLTRIKTKSHFFNTLLQAFGFLKFPFPALEIVPGKGIDFKPLYF